MKWNKVEDGLPKNNDHHDHIYCLVFDAYHGEIVVRPYSKAHNCWDTEDGDDYYTDAVGGKITHWMPLPELPNKQNKEDKILKFSNSDIKTMVGYIIYGLGMVGEGMVNVNWWNKHIGKSEELPGAVVKDMGDTINMCLKDLQDEGSVI